MRDSTWQQILSEGFSSASELLHFLQLPPALGCDIVETQFKTRVPRGFAARMQRQNPQDPLLLQVLATAQEQQMPSNYSADPLQELSQTPLPGLLHKYHGRVLLTLTGSCAVHCRYCFRRHFPYQAHHLKEHALSAVIDYIASDTSIEEIILSGGDPLLASDRRLSALLAQLAHMPHIKTLRFHTRIPIVLPERIDPSFLAIMDACHLQKVMVLHCNHPQELDDRVMHACQQLRSVGLTLLNQSVLLANVNDHVPTLVALSKKLFAFGILPYYLHVLDKVQGAAHFDMPLERARDIFKGLQQQLPGYLVPRLAREDATEKHKTLLGVM